jgi:lantibiotic biosynthesis protein
VLKSIAPRWSKGLKTPSFHGGNTGSNPVRGTQKVKAIVLKKPFMIFQPARHLVFRTPRLPIQNALQPFKLYEAVNDILFMEAVFLASPVLYKECMRYKEGRLSNDKEIQKLSHSLLKYHLRMSNRCTPFGLFSGCSVASWAENGNSPAEIQLPLPQQTERHTRLDMHYLCALAEQLTKWPAIKDNLLFYTNSSLYTLGGEWRYVEYQYINGKRNHHISAATASVHLSTTIKAAANGITINELAILLTNEEITVEDAEGFIEELIESHILVSELEPAITGNEFIHQVIQVLQRINTTRGNEGITQIINLLKRVHQMISDADAALINPSTVYTDIQSLLTILEVPFDEGKLFQTDLVKNPAKAVVSNAVQQQLNETLHILNLLTGKEENENLKRFAARFYERHEEKEMPLLEVLDTETGIGYIENSEGDLTPLVDALFIPGVAQTSHKIGWGMMEKFLSEKLYLAVKKSETVINITEEDITYLKKTYQLSENWNDLPPSFSVMFRLLNLDGYEEADNYILFEHAGNSSAANLLGRFAHADEKVFQLVSQITQHETIHNPDVLFAEIVHLPESRIGNILLHPVFRQYEIPYLAKSSLPAEQQITLQDIMVSVKQGEIILRSKKLNKRIIPRLSSAHNFSYNAQPVYQFLCDLQTQGLRSSLYFSWGSLEVQHPYLPRVLYKKTVLAPAKWNFQKKHYEQLFNCSKEELKETVKVFMQEWGLPQYSLLVDGDNELLINWNDTTCVEMLIETIRNRNGIQLKEFLANHPSSIADENGNAYCNQFIAAYLKEQPTYYYTREDGNSHEKPVIQRTFEPGSHWLYYKLYCGIKTADKILEQVITPLIKTLQSKHLIGQWFFIRYNDPHFHLRLRFHVTDANNTGTVMELFRKSLESFTSEGLVWKCITDTYVRELERYGFETITHAESLFFEDSNTMLQMLALTEGDEREHIRWLWAMRNIDEWLNVFSYSLKDKLQLLEGLKTVFSREFNTNKQVQQELGNLYRKHKKEIETMMHITATDEHDWVPLADILNQRSIKIKPIAGQLIQNQQQGLLNPSLNHLMGSYIHMIMNRICTSKARMQEMVVYDFLYCYYKSAIARTDKGLSKTKKNETSFVAVHHPDKKN